MDMKCPKCGCTDDLMGDGDRIECPDCGYESREENFIDDGIGDVYPDDDDDEGGDDTFAMLYDDDDDKDCPPDNYIDDDDVSDMWKEE